jgi:hypothetical protein
VAEFCNMVECKTSSRGAGPPGGSDTSTDAGRSDRASSSRSVGSPARRSAQPSQQAPHLIELVLRRVRPGTGHRLAVPPRDQAQLVHANLIGSDLATAVIQVRVEQALEATMGAAAFSSTVSDFDQLRAVTSAAQPRAAICVPMILHLYDPI